MPNNIVEEIDPNTSVNAHDLGAKEIEQLRDARWRARHDFFFLANTVLGKDLICPEFNGNLVNLLQKFPKPSEVQAKMNDRWTSDGWKYTPITPRMTELPGKRRRLIIDFRSSLKCLMAGNLVRLPNGIYKPVETLTPGDTIAATEHESSLAQGFTKIVKIENFEQPCYEVKFRSGRALKVSDNHPFRKVNEWVETKDLKPGTRIALHASTPEPKGAKYLPEAEILGWLIGDGSMTSGNCLVTSHYPELRKKILQACQKANFDAIESGDGLGVRIRGARSRLRAFGIYDKNSYEKFVPEAIFKANNQSIREFLYGLFMSDATLGRGGMVYTTVSNELAKGVQKILLRLNIFSILRKVEFKYKGQPKTVYNVAIQDQRMIKRFLDQIPWDKMNKYVPGKYNPNINLVPKEWRSLYPKYFFKKGTKPKNTKLRTFKGLTTYNTNKDILKWLGDNTNDKFLQFLASDEIVWDEVSEIIPIGIQKTYGIETESKTIDVDDIVTHNTTCNCEVHSIQWALNYPLACIAIFQYKLEKAESILSSIKQHFLYNARFRALFPEYCPPEDKLKDFGTKSKFSLYNINEIRKTARREDTFMTAALEAGLAGYHFEIMKFSDVVDPENSENLDQCAKTTHKFGQSLNLLVSPAYWLDVEGTRYHFGDLYGKLIQDWKQDLADRGDENTIWSVYTRGIFKPNMAEKDIKYLPHELEVEDLIVDGKRVPYDFPDRLNEKRFPLQELEYYEKNDPTNFWAQMKNVPMGGRGGIMDFKLNLDKTTGKLDTLNIISKKDYERFPKAYSVLSVDPAETTNERSNYTAMIYATVDRDGRTYIEQIIHGKWDPTGVSDKILWACDRFKPEVLLMEEVSATRNMLPGIKRAWDHDPQRHHIPTVKFNKRDTKVKKEEKIRLMLHHPYHMGNLKFVKEMILPNGWENLVMEMQQFPRGLHDDILDALAEIYAARDWFGQEFSRRITSPHKIKWTPELQQKLLEEKIWGETIEEETARNDSGNYVLTPQNFTEYLRKVGGL